jgi:hypothetical protein
VETQLAYACTILFDPQQIYVAGTHEAHKEELLLITDQEWLRVEIFTHTHIYIKDEFY